MAIKPPKHPVRMMVVIFVANVLLNLGVSALRGWGPDPWWQRSGSMLLFIWAFMWAWNGFTQPERPGPQSKA